MSAIFTLNEASAELVVKRSRFIALSFPIDSEENAIDILNGLRKKYWDSTHICYAYVADEKGLIAKSSDDGEPSGTAGAPILAVLTGGGYKKTLLAVVRYFGGTKLGVGGLVKAYTDCAHLVEKAAGKTVLVYCSVYSASLDYNQYKRIAGLIGDEGKIISARYGDTVEVTLAVKESGNLIEKLVGATAGKAVFTKRYEGYMTL